MDRSPSVRPAIGFRIAATASLLWSLVGCYAYITDVGMTAEDITRLPLAQRGIWEAMPGWVIVAYAFAVWPALLGSVILLLRKARAAPLFVISLLAILAQFGWTFLETPIFESVGLSTILLPLLIVLAALAQIWIALWGIRRGWLV